MNGEFDRATAVHHHRRGVVRGQRHQRLGHRGQRQRRVPDGDLRAGDGRPRRPSAADGDRPLPRPGTDRAVHGRGRHGSRRPATGDGERNDAPGRTRCDALARDVRPSESTGGRLDDRHRQSARAAAVRRMRGPTWADRRLLTRFVRAARGPAAPRRRRVPARRADGAGRDRRLVRVPRRPADRRVRGCSSSPTRSRRRCSTRPCRWRGCRRSS